jgi:DNA-binding SARP family transcriptional activator
MLSGYECSILGFDQIKLKDRANLADDFQKLNVENEKLTGYSSEILIQNAWSLVRVGESEKAGQIIKKIIAREPNTLFAAEGYILLGNIAAETFDYMIAEKDFYQAAAICRLLENEKGIGISLQNLAALVYLTQGRVDLALSIMEESNYHLVRANAPAWGYPLLQAYLFDIFGDRTHLLKALDELILQIKPGSYAAGVYFLIWAKICLDDNETQKADEYLRLAFRIANQLEFPDLSSFVRNEKSRYFRTKGQFSVAKNWAEDSVNFCRRIKNPFLLGHALIELGQVSWLAEDAKGAEKDFSNAISQLKRANSPLDSTRAEFLLAALLQNQKDKRADDFFAHATDEIIRNGYTSVLYRDRKMVYPMIAYYLKKSRKGSQEKAVAILDLVMQTVSVPLKILGFGQFRVWLGQHPLPDQSWSRRKSGVLFRFLLLQPDRSASREMAMEALWPELDPSSAADTLYQATSSLRRMLEPDLPEKFPSRYLVIEAERLTLKLPSGSYVDFNQFEMELPGAIKNRKVEDLQRLLALHEGELFPMDPYADWVAERRNQLETLYLQGLHQLGMLNLIQQDYYQELEISRKILKIDPWNEDAVLMGMQAYLGMKNAPRGLIFYKEFEKNLEKELGIKPRSDLRELAAEISAR